MRYEIWTILGALRFKTFKMRRWSSGFIIARTQSKAAFAWMEKSIGTNQRWPYKSSKKNKITVAWGSSGTSKVSSADILRNNREIKWSKDMYGKWFHELDNQGLFLQTNHWTVDGNLALPEE